MTRASTAIAALVAVVVVMVAAASACSGDGPTRPPGTPDAFGSAGSASASTSAGSSVSIASGSTNPSGLAVGQCFDSDGFSLSAPLDLSTARVVPCGGPHQQEVYAVVLEQDPPGAPYPGDQVLTSFASDTCLAAFSAYTGVDYETSSLDIANAHPTQSSWTAGDRAVICALHDANFDPLLASARAPK